MKGLEEVIGLRDRGRYREAVELADGLIETVTDRRSLLRLLKLRGWLLKELDRPGDAERDFRRVLELFDGDSGLREAVLCRRGLALLHYGRPNMGACLAEHRRELELAERLGDPAILCGTLANLAHLHIQMGRPAEAGECARRQLSQAASLQDGRLISLALSNLGRALMFHDRPRQARECFAEQLALAEESGEPLRVSAALNNLSMLEMEAGRYGEALTHLQRQLELGRAEGIDRTVAVAMGNMSVAYLHLGRHRMALDHAREHFRMGWEGSDWHQMTLALDNMAEAYVHLLDPESAAQCYDKLLRNAEAGGLRHRLAEGLVRCSGVERALGRPGEAFAHASRACRIFRARSDDAGELRACLAALQALPAASAEAGDLLDRAGELAAEDGSALGQRLRVQAARHHRDAEALEGLAESLDDLPARAEALAAAGRRGRARRLLRERLDTGRAGNSEVLLLLSLEG